MRVYCDKTAEARITQFSEKSSLEPLVKFSQNSSVLTAVYHGS